MPTSQGKDETRVAAGLKATINNPRTSEEAKDSAQERLQSMGRDESASDAQDDLGGDGKNTGNVLRGYKATLSNPRTSERAKEHAEEVLAEHDAL